jgi:hypothetical protein
MDRKRICPWARHSRYASAEVKVFLKAESDSRVRTKHGTEAPLFFYAAPCEVAWRMLALVYFLPRSL